MAAKTKILVVSNDPVMMRFLQKDLNDGDYQVIGTQCTGGELGAILTEESIDLIILDIMMPNLDGIEVCLRIRQWSQIPIILLSAWGAGEGKVRGLDLAAEGYLTEPFGIDRVVAMVKEALRHQLAASCVSSTRRGVGVATQSWRVDKP